MATVGELTAAYTNLLRRPQPASGVCEVCWNLTDGYRRCYACTHQAQWLAAVAPISYSIAHEQLHHVLAGYKRWPAGLAEHAQLELAAVLWRHLLVHERCHAAAARVAAFDLVTTVPGGTGERDAEQPLRRVMDFVEPVRARYQRLLVRNDRAAEARHFDPNRFTPTKALAGDAVLLIDDTWTTGASAQSAAATLRSAGARTVVAVVIGRHVNREWRQNDRHLRSLEQPYDWRRCVHCAGAPALNCRPQPAAQIPSSPHAAAG